MSYHVRMGGPRVAPPLKIWGLPVRLDETLEPGEIRIEVHRFPMLDTGIGRELGYANDAGFLEAAAAQREEMLGMLTPEGRARFEAVERQIDHEFLFGKSHG